MSRKSVTRLFPRAPIAVLATVLCVLFAPPGESADLSTGEYTLNLDTTISWGANYRLEDPDLRLIGLPSGGSAFSVNGDDGNLNFDKGISSNAFKASVDLDFAYKDFGFFVRGFGFYDYEMEDAKRLRTQLTPAALDRVGSRAELRDYYAWWRFPKGEFRVGNQVLNWGESTFIQGGLNAINPVDVSALRVPGAELRDALLPVGLVWGSVDLSQNVSVEGFYQYKWEGVRIDPPGSYFSTNDFAGAGGTHVFLAFASFPDTGVSPFFIQPPVDRPFMAVPRGEDARPDDSGQYGAALRWLVPALNETEIGLYYMNYHSRLPTVNGVTGSLQGASAASSAGAAAAALIYQLRGVPPFANPAVDAEAAAIGNAAAIDAFAATAEYFIAYPEDIKLYGISFNTQLGTSGIALQGEIAFREDLPLQMDDVEVLFAALSPISDLFGDHNQVSSGRLGFSQEIVGTRRHDATQAQFTATKVFGPMGRADQGVLLLEAAYDHVSGMPSKDVLRYDGPGTYTSGNPFHATVGAHAGKAFEPASAFADPDSYGYRLAGRLDYNNAFSAFNLSPRFSWQHDVSGVSPGPGGNFIEGLTAITLGIAATYQNSWELDFSWTSYGGAGRYNLINDRDFIATNVKYSF